jgi:hypothetical protein
VTAGATTISRRLGMPWIVVMGGLGRARQCRPAHVGGLSATSQQVSIRAGWAVWTLRGAVADGQPASTAAS